MILKFSMDIDFSNNLIPVRKKLLVSSEFYYIRKLNFGINDDQALFDFYLENKLEEEQRPAHPRSFGPRLGERCGAHHLQCPLARPQF